MPKEKITQEISDLRGVPMGKDVVSPPYHAECRDAASTVKFIRRVQEVSELPVGIKLCLGRDTDLVGGVPGHAGHRVLQLGNDARLLIIRPSPADARAMEPGTVNRGRCGSDHR